MNWFKKFWRTEIQPAIKGEATVENIANLTPRAQQVLALSRKEAYRLNHNYLGTEHLLLGLIKLGNGVAVNVLAKLGLHLETVRKEVEKQVGKGPDKQNAENVPYTPRVKKVLALADKERRALNHTYLGTEHILLGLLREGDGCAARVLKSLDVDIEQTRQEILRELDPNFSPQRDDEKCGLPKNSVIADPKHDSIDTNKRYDIYCAERNQEIVIYRNALFKGIKKLYQTRQYDFMSEFIELEQADGQTVFLARSSVVKFCEHGVVSAKEQ